MRYRKIPYLRVLVSLYSPNTRGDSGGDRTEISLYVAIGKITAIITAVATEAGIEYKAELGDLIDERKQQINRAIEDGKNYGYVLDATRYFIVDKFYYTDVKKITVIPQIGGTE